MSSTIETENQFFVMLNGRELGPFTPEQVQTMLLKNEIHADSLIKILGTQQWVMVSQAFPGAAKPLQSSTKPSQQQHQTQQPQFSYADLEFPHVSKGKEEPLDFIKNCWDCYVWCLKNGFNKQGRIRRRHFWRFFLVHNFISACFSFLPLGLGYLGIIYGLLMIIPLACAGARRAHDHNKTGLVWLIPFYALTFVFSEGFRGNNNYGPDPKA